MLDKAEVAATWETRAGRSLEPRSSRPAWSINQDPVSKRQNQTKISDKRTHAEHKWR
jgi:hypothetical protein